MKKLWFTAFWLVVFAGLLVYVVTQQRGRVPEKEELLAWDVKEAGGISRIDAVQYRYEEAAPAEEAAEDEETETEEEGESAEAAEAEEAGKAKQEKATEAGANRGKTSERQVKQRLQMEKRGDDWYLTAPFEGMADPDKAEGMVEAIAQLKPKVRKDEDPTAEKYGLDKPKLVVTAGLTNGGQIRIDLGKDAPVGGKVYARISDRQGLYLVPSSFTTDFEEEPEKLRYKKLADFEKENVTEVTFVNEQGTTIVAEKRGSDDDARWQITAPNSYKGDEWAITSAFGKVKEVEAKEFAKVPKDLGRFGLDKPRARCTIKLKDGKVIEVLVGKQITQEVKKSEYSEETEEKDLVYTMRKGRPEVLLVDASLFDELNKDVMAFRDKQILEFDRENVTTVRVSRKEGFSFAVNRVADGWNIVHPTVGKAKSTKVDDILWDLTDLEAKEYLGAGVDLRAKGLAVPSNVITVRLRNDKEIKVKFGDSFEKEGATRYYCMVSGDDQVYEVGDMLINGLPEDADALKQEAESTGTESPPDMPMPPKAPPIE